MTKKSILLACPTSVHFVQEYIENVLDDKIFDIYFLTWRTDENEKIWKEKNVKVITLLDNNDSKIMKFIKLPFKFLHLRRKLKGLDIIHYHFIDNRFTHLVDFFVGRIAKKTILSFWGSDLLRQPEKIVQGFSKLYKRASKINLMNAEMYDIFERITASEYSKKSLILDFGNSTLDAIKIAKKNKTRQEIKKFWNIPENKICVHLGYNGFKAQQHLEMIKSLSSCNNEIINKIYIIVPLSYGCPNEDYKNEIINRLNEANISYSILDNFIEKDKIGEFRLTADIFLYGQTTDAVSASMIEYFAAGSTVIKPEWLVYSELIESGIKMIEYKNFDTLSFVLKDAILNSKFNEFDFNNNSSIIYNLKSWYSLKNKWLEMYDEK